MFKQICFQVAPLCRLENEVRHIYMSDSLEIKIPKFIYKAHNIYHLIRIIFLRKVLNSLEEGEVRWEKIIFSKY